MEAILWMSGNVFEVATQLAVARPVSEVFEAIVNPAEMAHYFITTGSGRLDGGRPVSWHWADHDGATLEVTPREIVPGRRIVFSWEATGWETTVTIDLEGNEAGGTDVNVCEAGPSRGEESHAKGLEQMQGWMHMLCCLKAYLEFGINLRAGERVGRLLVTRPDLSGGSLRTACERIMREPPDVLYRAWTTREFGKWFGHSGGTVLMDPEVNAPFYFEARHEGRRHPHYGRFLRLEPDRLVEMAWMNEEGTKGAETLVTVELLPQGEGTLLKLTHEGFPDEATRDAHAEAWPLGLEYLDTEYHPAS